jgi:hypothetical protein
MKHAAKLRAYIGVPAQRKSSILASQGRRRKHSDADVTKKLG